MHKMNVLQVLQIGRIGGSGGSGDREDREDRVQAGQRTTSPQAGALNQNALPGGIGGSNTDRAGRTHRHMHRGPLQHGSTSKWVRWLCDGRFQNVGSVRGQEESNGSEHDQGSGNLCLRPRLVLPLPLLTCAWVAFTPAAPSARRGTRP